MSKKYKDYVIHCAKGPFFRHTGIPGLWTLDSGLWTLDSGPWAVDAGLWTLDSGRWTPDTGLWTLDTGRWTLGAGPWTLDVSLITQTTIQEHLRVAYEYEHTYFLHNY